MMKKINIVLSLLLVMLCGCSKLSKYNLFKKQPKEKSISKHIKHEGLEFPPHYNLPEHLKNTVNEELN